MSVMMMAGVGTYTAVNDTFSESSVSVSAADSGTGNYRINTGAGLNIRTGPGTGYGKLGAAANGTQFTVTKTQNGWGYGSIRCTNGTKNGWACLQYCSFLGRPSTEKSVNYQVVITTTAGLNMRSQANSSSSKLTAIPYNKVVTVTKESNGWGYTSYGGKSGWISLSYTAKYTAPKYSSTNLSQALYKNSSAKITCGFNGYTSTPGKHEGIDISLATGKPIYSLTDGEVIRVANGYRGSSGLSTIAIYYAAQNKTVIYLHCAPVNVWNGKKVSKGQQIGTQDWRGVSSASGSHTHVEVRSGRQQYAAKSVNDYKLENPNPASFWNSLGYNVK